MDMTKELFGIGSGSRPSKDAAILLASSRPPFPVTALAQPELMMMDLILDLLACLVFLSSKTCLLIVTGAAWKTFFVKRAAAEHALSEVIKARSGKVVLEGLTPT